MNVKLFFGVIIAGFVLSVFSCNSDVEPADVQINLMQADLELSDVITLLNELVPEYFENDLNETSLEDAITITSSKSMNFELVGDEVYKKFDIECPEAGAYYMCAWIMPPITNDGFREYKIEINGILSDYSFKPQTWDWQSLALTNVEKTITSVELKEGNNSISVIGQLREVPMVEFIQVSTNRLGAKISDDAYRDFVEKIRTNTLIPVISVIDQKISLDLTSEKGEKAYIRISDAYGIMEFDSSYQVAKGGQSIVVDVSDFKKGLYILQIVYTRGETATFLFNI
jgi:hypothetical protein